MKDAIQGAVAHFFFLSLMAAVEYNHWQLVLYDFQGREVGIIGSY